MGDDVFVVIGKTMRLEISRSGYAMKDLTAGHFRGNQWVSERPLITIDDQKASIPLTEAFRAIDQYRVRFKKR